MGRRTPSPPGAIGSFPPAAAEPLIPHHVIRRKRDGEPLPAGELAEFLEAYAAGRAPDYQMAALLMAIYFRGLEAEELTAMVDVMLRSGITLDLSHVLAPKIDKHSTGGVGDKVSLILAPLLASLGVCVPMMTGRGLGHTGGTSDKLEAIPGFRTGLGVDELLRQLESIGCALVTPTREIAPLDRRLYALRDVTATVPSIPLIASSIMSKKLAEGIDGLVLDVKRGSGAFLGGLEDALALARTMIAIGEERGCRVVALLTAMDRPLGRAVGNALETEEAILALRGEGPADLIEVTVSLAAEMVLMAGLAADPASARGLALSALDDGRALARMRLLVEAQGGNPAVLDDPALLPQAPLRRTVTAGRDGYVRSVDAFTVGEAAVALGAGRRTIEDRVDPAVGFHITAKPGARVSRGEPLATVFASGEEAARGAEAALNRAIPLADEAPPVPLPLISHRVSAAGVEEVRSAAAPDAV